MRKVLIALALLCGAVSAHAAEATAWCEGKDQLTIENGHFSLNGQPLPDGVVTDATEETVIAFEYDGRLFLPCP